MALPIIFNLPRRRQRPQTGGGGGGGGAAYPDKDGEGNQSGVWGDGRDKKRKKRKSHKQADRRLQKAAAKLAGR